MVHFPNTDLNVFPLNLGGNSFGWTSNEPDSYAVPDAFVAEGGNFIDTADSYSTWSPAGGGASERIIGNWMSARENRSDVVLATKVGALPDRKGLAADNVNAALDDSLLRLQTDYVDLYYFHYDDAEVSISDQVHLAHSLVESGRAHHIGLSNYTPERMREFFETATSEGLTVPVAIQPEYNLVRRKNYEENFRPIAEEFGIAVFPYYALASGFLTGKYRTEADLEGKQRGGAAEAFLNAEGLGVIDALVSVADSRGVEPATIALAWLRAKGVTAPIASASRPEQLPALMKLADIELSAEEVAQLDDASAPFA